jgi:predicted nuclease of predicted toxin-antitoxin system
VKILIDMNLTPDWATAFSAQGIESVHWSAIGDPGARDEVLMEWARMNGYTVFTHDLDFGTILALTQAAGPSVIQIRTQDVLPSKLSKIVIAVLKQYESALKQGALIVVDEGRERVRILPII